MSSPSQPSSAPSLQELRAARGKTPSAPRRYRKWIIAVGVAGSLVLFGFFGLPPIVKAQAVKQLSARLGRAVSIERIRINPLVFSVTVEGFAVVEADAAAGEFTGWRRLHVNLDSWPLLAGNLRFQEIELDGFRARVAKGEDGGLNFDDIVAKLTAPVPGAPPPEAKDPEARPAPVAIGRLAVTDAQVSFTDASRERPFATVVGPLTFTLTNFQTVGEPDSPYQFEAVTAAGERFAWKGTVSADPIKSRGELVLANVDLARLSPYYHQLVKGELRSAFADISGRYTFELKDGAPALTLADGALTLRDVRFGAPGVAADAFALKRLAVTGVSADSVSLKAAVAKIAVEGLRVKATRDARGIDLLGLIHPVSGPASGQGGGSVGPSAPAAGLARPVITVGEFSLSDVQADVTDLTMTRRAEHRVENLVLTLRDLDSDNLAKSIPLSLELKLPQEGRIAVSGTVALRPTIAELDVFLERVAFANASPYLEPFLNIRLAGGVLRTSGKVSLRDGVVGFAGDFGVGGFATVDGKLAQDFVKWSDLSVTGILASSRPLSLHMDTIRLVDPSASVRVEPDGTLNIDQAFVSSSRTKSSPVDPDAANASSPVSVAVGRFELEGGAFRFEDRSIKPAARGALTGFSGTVSGLSSEALGRADVDLHGKVDGFAPVAITGKLNPLGTPAFVDLKLDFKGIDLQPGAGPYIGKFAGRELSRGSLNVAVTAKLAERRVDMTNVVTLDQFYLGGPTNSPEATKLPVGLALALLRDTEGRIVVDLPVKGSLDDPNFKIGRVLLRVLGNVLTKAATSPFSLLGAAFGGGGDELGWQDFGSGTTSPDEKGIKKLETLAMAMKGRPALALDIVGAYDPVNDLAALRFDRLDERVRAAAWEARRLVDPNTPAPELIDITPQLHEGMVARLYAEAFPSIEGGTDRADEGESVSPEVVAPVARVESEVEVPARRRIARLPKFYEKGEYARGAASPRPPESSPEPVRDNNVAPEAGASAPEEAVSASPTVSPEDMEARLAALIEVTEAELQAVGEARAQAIRAWLIETGKVAPERIFLAPVAATGTRVNLNLK